MGTARNRLKAAGLMICAALSLVSLSISPAAEPSQNLGLHPFSAVWAMSAMALCWGMRALWQRPRAFARIELWILAAIFAAVTTLAQSFAATGTTQLFTQNPSAKASALLFYLGRVSLYYLAMALLSAALSREVLFDPRIESGGEGDRVARFASRRKSVAIIALVLLLCWLPYYITTFPGTVSNDSITQLKEIYGVKPLSAGNPLAQTYWLWFFCALGDALGSADAAVALYCAVQALGMAILLAYTIRVMICAGAPLWLCAFSLGFFALCPVFPVFAFCVGKDTNFAMAVLFFTLMVWHVLRQPKTEPLPLRYTAGLCLAAALLPLLRNPGFYLALMALAVLLFWVLRRPEASSAARPWLGPVCALAAAVVVWGGFRLTILPMSGAEPMPETEEYSLPLQQVARIVASQPDSLSAEERASISAVLDIEKIQSEYNGELSDPVKNLWNTQATPEEKRAFWKTWLSLLAKYPATCLSATFHNTYGYLTPGYVTAIKPTLLIGKQARTTEIDALFPFSVNPTANALKSLMDELVQQPLFRLLLAPGLYGCLALFALASLLASRRKSLLLAAFPALFTLMGCLLSAVNGYFRYAMPLYFCAPVLLALCAEGLKSSAPPLQKE